MTPAGSSTEPKAFWPITSAASTMVAPIRAATGKLGRPTAIRARVRQGAVVAQVEASVAEECPSLAMSTSSLAARHRELPRVVRVMRFEDALLISPKSAQDRVADRPV